MLGEGGYVGRPMRRKEDAALLTGKGRYADDLPTLAGTLVAHVLRSPHAHALIRSIDTTRAVSLDGVTAVITGEDIRRLLQLSSGPSAWWAVAAGLSLRGLSQQRLHRVRATSARQEAA